MNTETMSVETKAAPEITRAAERYLEQYGDPLVMNTYLKVTIPIPMFQLSTLVGGPRLPGEPGGGARAPDAVK